MVHPRLKYHLIFCCNGRRLTAQLYHLVITGDWEQKAEADKHINNSLLCYYIIQYSYLSHQGILLIFSVGSQMRIYMTSFFAYDTATSNEKRKEKNIYLGVWWEFSKWALIFNGKLATIRFLHHQAKSTNQKACNITFLLTRFIVYLDMRAYMHAAILKTFQWLGKLYLLWCCCKQDLCKMTIREPLAWK